MPVARNGRRYRVGGNRSSSRISEKPSRKAPVRLVQKVAHGNCPAVVGTASASLKRAVAPIIPPTAMTASRSGWTRPRRRGGRPRRSVRTGAPTWAALFSGLPGASGTASVQQIERALAAWELEEEAIGLNEMRPPELLRRPDVVGFDEIDESLVGLGAVHDRSPPAGAAIGEPAQLGHVDDLAEHRMQQRE